LLLLLQDALLQLQLELLLQLLPLRRRNARVQEGRTTGRRGQRVAHHESVQIEGTVATGKQAGAARRV
jgi:hypothetical protein